MKRRLFSKLGLFTMMVASILTVSATTVNGEVGRVVYFPIQSNVACTNPGSGSTLTYSTGFHFTVSNISSVPSTIVLKLYKSDGSELTTAGTTATGTMSTIIPGNSITINSQQSQFYSIFFGQTATNSCEDRPHYGKLIVDSGSGMLIATGEVRSWREGMVNNSTVIVNEGKPF